MVPFDVNKNVLNDKRNTPETRMASCKLQQKANHLPY